MRGLRWLALPAVAALTVLLFALTAGIGSARTAVAPNNTAPPTISGKAQVGELLKADKGTWTGTGTLTTIIPASFTHPRGTGSSVSDNGVAYQVGGGTRIFFGKTKTMAFRADLALMKENTFSDSTTFTTVSAGITWKLGGR